MGNPEANRLASKHEDKIYQEGFIDGKKEGGQERDMRRSTRLGECHKKESSNSALLDRECLENLITMCEAMQERGKRSINLETVIDMIQQTFDKANNQESKGKEE